MKIALIQCPGWGRDCPPYAIALLSALVRNNGHEAFCFDINNELYHSGPKEYRVVWDEKDLYSFWNDKVFISELIQANNRILEQKVDEVLKTDAKVIGFTVHFSSLLVSLEVARRIKQLDKKRIIIFGGPDCIRELRGLDIAKNEFIDAVAIGEGDITILELVNILETKGVLDFCKGLLVRNNGSIVDCGDGEIARNLDELPFPDYTDFKKDIITGLYREPNRLDILDSRGCFMQCYFCSEWQFWKKFRSLSGERIYLEILHQIKHFPSVDSFYFIGSLLNGDIKALSKFCDLIIENGIKIKWAGQAIVRPEMTKELLEKMQKAGCKWLGYGIESGSQKVIHNMNKRFNISEAERVLRNTREAGIEVQANFMFGLPTETEENFKETLGFLKRNRNNVDSVLASQSFCVIDKGTYLHSNPEKFKLENKEHHLYWEADGGINSYPERFRRYEEFCKVALSLGLPETSGALRHKPDKWLLLGDYYSYKEDYKKAVSSYKLATEIEPRNMGSLEQFVNTLRKLERDNIVSYDELEAIYKSACDKFSYNFGNTQKTVINSLASQKLWKKLFNYMVIEKQKDRRDTFVIGYPYWLTIDPANICTLKCPFCPTGQQRNSRPKEVMSFQNFKKIIDELGSYLIHIDFCNWGEPLLNKELFDMIAYAKKFVIDTKVDTNLNCFSEEDAEKIVLSGLDRLIISIDGASPETYSKYRIGGDFNMVIENLKVLINKKRQLNRRNPHITWQFLVFRHNEHEIEKVKRLGEELGVDTVGITKAFIGNKDWFPLNEEYSHYKKEKIDGEHTSEHFKTAPGGFCSWPWEAIAINSNGSVSPCCSVEDEKDDFGNIFEDKFRYIWNCLKYRQARSYMKYRVMSNDVDENVCSDCRHRGLTNLNLLDCKIISDSKFGLADETKDYEESSFYYLDICTSYENYNNNKELQKLEYKEGKIILDSNPSSFYVILTSRCNLECIMCSRVRQGDLTLNFGVVKKFFSLLPYLDIVFWQGGEVFLVDYFKELFMKVARYPYLRQHITTNGLLIDEDWAKIFSHSNVILLYSVEAVIKSTYESIRLGAEFKDLIKSLELVNKTCGKDNRKVELQIRATVMKRNYRELYLLPDFCKKYNFRKLIMDYLVPDVIPEEDILITPDYSAIEYLNKILPEIEKKCEEYNIEFDCMFKSYLTNFFESSNKHNNGHNLSRKIEESPYRYECRYPWTRLFLNYDGKLYPDCKCCHSVGNLKNESWKEVWNNKIMQLYRNMVSSGQGDKICSETCKTFATLNREEI